MVARKSTSSSGTTVSLRDFPFYPTSSYVNVRTGLTVWIVPFGLLIASNGITGDADDLNAAQQHLHNALIGDNIKIIVVDRTELCSIASTEALMAMLQQKIARLILRGA
jgi:hypothetical protein